MFWEIAEDIRKAVKMTIVPAMRNLFSSFKSLVGMFLVMLVLQMLLSVICISGIENIKNQQTVLNDFNELISSSDEKDPLPQRRETPVTSAGTDAETDSDTAEDTLDEVQNSARTISTALSSTSIFIGALLIWGVCALTVYQKITFAAADRDKYLWGMYITHGAKIRKIRAMLKCELYTPHLAATAIAYPLSIFLCNRALRSNGYEYGHSLITIIAILVLSYICIRLVVEYECFLIRRMSCVEMLREEDSPKSVCFPRRHSRLIRGFTAPRYATNTFLRMRKYYISLAAIAAVPAVIWTCFHVSATSEDKYLASDIGEFTVTAKNGITEEELEKIMGRELISIDGVSYVTAGAYFEAGKIYTHMITDIGNYTDTGKTPYYTTVYADNSLVLCCSDRAFKQSVGYSMSSIKRGTVKILAPATDPQYNFSEGDKIILAVSKLDGSIRAVDTDGTLLSADMSEEWEYMTLEVESYTATYAESLTSNSFLNVKKTYFVLNKDDYKTLTALSTDGNAQILDTESITATSALGSNADFNITIDRALLTKLPSAGDCVEVDGNYKLNGTLTAPEDEKEDSDIGTWTVAQSKDFEYAYINSVTVNGDKVTLNVSPYDIITLQARIGPFPGKYVAIGTPALTSNTEVFCPATAGDALVLSGGSVSLSSSTLTIHTSSAITAGEVGSHAMLSEKNLVSTENRLKLEELYADNSFVIACNDSTTRASLGLDIPATEDGETVIVLPSLAYHHYNLSVGDKARFAITLDDVAERTSDAITVEGSYDTLQTHIIRNRYEYVSCKVTEIVYSDSVSVPHAFVSTDNYSAIIDKSAPYVNMSVYLDSGIESDSYTEIRSQISRWATGKTYLPSVSSTGEYLQYLLRKNANYSTLIMLISTLIPLIVPFIWYHPLAALHERRKTEFSVLHAMGKRKKQIRATFAIEGLLVSLGAFATVLVVIWPAMLVFKLICGWCKLPIEFEYANLSLPVLLAAALFSAVCAAVSFAIGYMLTAPKQRKNTQLRRKHGNT